MAIGVLSFDHLSSIAASFEKCEDFSHLLSWISRSLIIFSHCLAGLQQPALPAYKDTEFRSGEPETV